MSRIVFVFLVLISSSQCSGKDKKTVPEITQSNTAESPPGVITGAEQLDILLPKIKNKRIALVVNYTAMIGDTHLADTLKSLGINIKKIMGPEHGFRGTAVAGEHVKDGIDTKTGLPVVSLYGTNRKPTPEQLADTDVVIFDIQDVGVRFFTYIGTMHYVMEACAENGKKLIILDRPNPNGNYVDGPVLQPEFKSFVGMHPVPVVHGLTVGEYAQMINGEGWLNGGVTCDLEIISLKNWKHDDRYLLPVKPSPNLPNDQAVKLYPSICFFEGTVLSLGRGTLTPFQVIGHPALKNMSYQFTPVTIEGMVKNPPHENKVCYGLDLRNVPVPQKIELHYLLEMYEAFQDKQKFFTPFFEKLAGNAVLRQQIKDGLTEEQIRETWKKDLEGFKEKMKKYLLYN
jgi:uncharacterized protein YbbC (DUF1343 family)